METFKKHNDPKPVFTPGELKVLQMVSDGFTNIAIASALKISVRTIETRRASMMHKSQTNDTASLVKFAMKNGLIV